MRGAADRDEAARRAAQAELEFPDVGGQQTDERLGSLDATFLELEQHEDGATMHIGGPLIFEPLPEARGCPSLDALLGNSTSASAGFAASTCGSRDSLRWLWLLLRWASSRTAVPPSG